MRARKLAFHGETLEEFQQKSVIKINIPTSYVIKHPKRIPQINPSRPKEIFSQSDSPKRKNPWMDFEFKETKSKQEKLEDLNSCFSEDNSNQQDDIYINKRVKRTLTKRFMVLGTSGTGKHALVNSLFGSDNDEEPMRPLKQSMDLVLKNNVEDGCENKYQFWITNVDTQKFEDVVKVYYRSASAFFFVYSINDQKSLEMVEKSIQRVKEEVSKEKFVGVLVGTQNDTEDRREVDLNEALLLKEKYNLAHFIETNSNDESLSQKFKSLGF